MRHCVTIMSVECRYVFLAFLVFSLLLSIGKAEECAEQAKTIEHLLDELKKTRQFSEDNVKIAKDVSDKQAADLEQCQSFQTEMADELQKTQEKLAKLSEEHATVKKENVALMVEKENKATGGSVVSNCDEKFKKEADALKANVSSLSNDFSKLKKESESFADVIKKLESEKRKASGPSEIYSFSKFKQDGIYVLTSAKNFASKMVDRFVGNEQLDNLHRMYISYKATYFDGHVKQYGFAAWKMAHEGMAMVKGMLDRSSMYTEGIAKLKLKLEQYKKSACDMTHEGLKNLNSYLDVLFPKSDTYIPDNGVDRMFAFVFILGFVLVIGKVASLMFAILIWPLFRFWLHCTKFMLCKTLRCCGLGAWCDKKKPRKTQKPKFQSRNSDNMNSHNNNSNMNDDENKGESSSYQRKKK